MMRLLVPVLLVLSVLVAPACGGDTETVEIQASVVIETPEQAVWTRDVTVPKGTDGYELLEAAVEGDLEADWFPAYRSHFVTSIRGRSGDGSSYWLVFVWDENSEAWQPLPIGADLFSVKDGHVMAWALIDTSLGADQVPQARP